MLKQFPKTAIKITIIKASHDSWGCRILKPCSFALYRQFSVFPECFSTTNACFLISLNSFLNSKGKNLQGSNHTTVRSPSRGRGSRVGTSKQKQLIVKWYKWSITEILLVFKKTSVNISRQPNSGSSMSTNASRAVNLVNLSFQESCMPQARSVHGWAYKHAEHAI